MIEVGAMAPGFRLPDQDGREVSLDDFRGKWVVLYFYPKDDTPGCTTEACDFTAALPDLEGLDAVVLGMSPDSPARHRKFADKHGIGFTLLSDEDKGTLQAYGAWRMKKNYGREYMGVVRSTVIIDPKGRIAAAWDNVKVRRKRKKDGRVLEHLHVDDVRQKLAELRGTRSPGQ